MSASSETLDRLTVEAGKYNGLTAGESVKREEVVKQAKAEGYSKWEAQHIAPDTETIEIPEQGDLFGELWADNRSDESGDGLPSVDSPELSTLEQFKDYCSNNSHEWNGEEQFDHTFNQQTAQKRFARAKSVDRHFNRTYDTYSTVVVTYCCEGAEGVAQQAESFYPRAVVRERRRILKELDVYDSYAGVSVLAPKYVGEDQLPSAVNPRTHAHDFYWIPDVVSADDFTSLIVKHIEQVESATVAQHVGSDNRLTGASVTVETWDDGTNYREPVAQTLTDVLRGATSSLPGEIGNNLAWLKHPYADYVERWSAGLWQGEDERTIPRWKPMGRPSRFKQIADEGKYLDKLNEGRTMAETLRRLPSVGSPTSPCTIK